MNTQHTQHRGPRAPRHGVAGPATSPANAASQAKQPSGQPRSRNSRRPRTNDRRPRYGRRELPSTAQNVHTLKTEAGTLSIIPLGGNEEVGRNMSIFEYENDIVILDMGLQWPEEDMPGIDYIIPNIECLKGKEKNIRGVIITHGHYDHIGAIPHLIPKLGNPTIYGTPLTLGIIANRQEDYKTPPLKLQSIETDSVLHLGKFRISFFGVSHNIPAAVGVVLETPVGAIMHTGDFKLDPKASGSAPAEVEKVLSWGRKGILALMADSTNAPQAGRQLTEGDIQGNIDEILATAKGRIILGTFASLLNRIQQIIWAAERLNKKVIIEGYSMKRNMELAQALGYMHVKKGTIIQLKDMKQYPDNRIIIICTGAQGEDQAMMMRIATKEHRSLHLEPGDTVVFSSSVIPGNERSVQRLKDVIYRQKAEVIHYQMMDVHAGGHARQEDLAEVIQMVKPKYHIPVYGNHSFLQIHAKVAEASGVPKKNIFVADNGQIIEFTKAGGKLTNKKVNSEYVFVDGLGVGDVSHVVLRDRQMMAADGMIVIIATIAGKSGKLTASPDIISRGFIYMRENKQLVEMIRAKIKAIINESEIKMEINDEYVKEKLRNELGQFIYTKTQRRPMILPVLIAV